MKYNKKILSALFLSLGLSVYSQQYNFYVGAGMHGISFEDSNIKNEMQVGGKAGAGYYYSFSEHWGLSTGIEGTMFRSSHSLTDGVYSSFTTDSEGEAFELRTITSGYSEKHQLTGLAIPLMLQFRIGGEHDTQFFMSAGPKIMFPLSHKVDASATSLETRGYYPDLNVEYENLPQHGFFGVEDWSNSFRAEKSTVFLAAVELGASIPIGNNNTLDIAAYGDYGLSKAAARSQTALPGSLIEYNYGRNRTMTSNGLLNVWDARPMAFGLSVRWHMNSTVRW